MEVDIPPEKADVVAEFNEALKESVAETSDEMMDKYFSGEAFTYAEMIQGLRQGVRGAVHVPRALRLRHHLHRHPDAHGQHRRPAAQPHGGQPPQGHHCRTARPRSSWSPPAACPRPTCGRPSPTSTANTPTIKVLSGVITSDHSPGQRPHRRGGKAGTPVHHVRQERPRRSRSSPAATSAPSARWTRSRPATPCATAGKVVALKGIPFPEPCYSMAIAPKTKGQDDKVGRRPGPAERGGPLLHPWSTTPETRQVVLSGTGDHAAGRAGLPAEEPLRRGGRAQSGPGRPTGRRSSKKVEAHGRHKKQTGGHGQFGDVWIRFEPQDEQEDMIFAEEVFGGTRAQELLPRRGKGPAGGRQQGRAGRLSRWSA